VKQQEPDPFRSGSQVAWFRDGRSVLFLTPTPLLLRQIQLL